VLSLPPSVRLFVATQPVDGRKGADSLMVIVRDVFGQDPLFCGERSSVTSRAAERHGFDGDVQSNAYRRATYFQAASRIRRTESFGRKRFTGRLATPASSRLRRIISAFASAYRCVLTTLAWPSHA
jgi:hypothetical protein